MLGRLGRTAAAAATTAVVVLTVLAPVSAQQPPQQPAPAPAGPNTGRLSFRGIVQETEDLILQPYLNLTVKLYEADQGVLTGINFTTGIWNSLHWGATGDSDLVGDPHNWYEADIIAGFSAVLAKDLTLGVTYTAYTSPNGFFNTVQEIALSASYNDSKLLGAFALNPSVTLAFELEG